MLISDSADTHPHVSKSGSRGFDPLKLAEATEKVVCKGNKRKYFHFGTTLDYKTGIATGYAVGCNLRCVFCWAHDTRDNIKKETALYSPDEVFERLSNIAKQKRLNQIRISDGEPTIGKQHLLGLIELAERSDIGRFVLETNGILLGHDSDYVKSLARFKKLYVRLDLKAGTPEDFTRKTGAIPEAFDLPFQGIKNLINHGINVGVAAMSADPRFMSPTERISLIGKLAEIDPELVLNLEEEMTILFPTTLKRLRASGWNLDGNYQPVLLRKMPVLRRFVQFSYEPVRSVGCRKISLRFTLKCIRDLIHGI